MRWTVEEEADLKQGRQRAAEPTCRTPLSPSVSLLFFSLGGMGGGRVAGTRIAILLYGVGNWRKMHEHFNFRNRSNVDLKARRGCGCGCRCGVAHETEARYWAQDKYRNFVRAGIFSSSGQLLVP